MKMETDTKIDWKQLAKDGGLTIEEFKHELILATVAIMAIGIDEEKRDNANTNRAVVYLGQYKLTVEELN